MSSVSRIYTVHIYLYSLFIYKYNRVPPHTQNFPYSRGVSLVTKTPLSRLYDVKSSSSPKTVNLPYIRFPLSNLCNVLWLFPLVMVHLLFSTLSWPPLPQCSLLSLHILMLAHVNWGRYGSVSLNIFRGDRSGIQIVSFVINGVKNGQVGGIFGASVVYSWMQEAGSAGGGTRRRHPLPLAPAHTYSQDSGLCTRQLHHLDAACSKTSDCSSSSSSRVLASQTFVSGSNSSGCDILTNCHSDVRHDPYLHHPSSAQHHNQAVSLAVPADNVASSGVSRSARSNSIACRRRASRVNSEQIPEEFMLAASPLSILPKESQRPTSRVFSAKSKFSQLKRKGKESATSLKGNHNLFELQNKNCFI